VGDIVLRSTATAYGRRDIVTGPQLFAGPKQAR
jgi:hypothetical protein